MKSQEFDPQHWIDGLARALAKLWDVQKPFLNDYWSENPVVRKIDSQTDRVSTELSTDDLRDLYAMAYQDSSRRDRFAGLRSAADPVRYLLLSHPSIVRVVGRLVGRDEFWIQVLHQGGSTTLTDLIAGLMAHASEQHEDGLQIAASKLCSLLCQAEGLKWNEPSYKLEIGYHAVLFYGLTVTEEISLEDGLAIVPFSQIQDFVDSRQLSEPVPLEAVVHGYRSVGAVVGPFRWRPALKRAGFARGSNLANPRSFFMEALTLVDLLAVAHATHVAPLAAVRNALHRSVGQLLGGFHTTGSVTPIGSTRWLDDFEGFQNPTRQALEDVKHAFTIRNKRQFRELAPALALLSGALLKEGRFGERVSFVLAAVALEEMYDVPERGVSSRLQNRVSEFLGTDASDRENLSQVVKEFYDRRSASVHRRRGNSSRGKDPRLFHKGFDVARRTFFKLLTEGSPENWKDIQAEGE